jgi:hypothetical protein
MFSKYFKNVTKCHNAGVRLTPADSVGQCKVQISSDFHIRNSFCWDCVGVHILTPKRVIENLSKEVDSGDI